MQRKLIIIIGEVCSGKDHFANEFYPSAEKIDVGNIVRSITKTQARIHNKQLDSLICIEIHKIINSTTKDIVITGIRQLSIYNNIQELSASCRFKIITYYLSVPHEILKERFKQRASEKDFNISFKEVIERDNKLGLAELIQVVLSNSQTIVKKFLFYHFGKAVFANDDTHQHLQYVSKEFDGDFRAAAQHDIQQIDKFLNK